MSEKIMTLHPEPGKQGANIDRNKYDRVRNAILKTLEGGETGFQEMVRTLEAQLSASFEGSVGWYATTVKLDLEARGEIERVPGSKPQKLRLVKRQQR